MADRISKTQLRAAVDRLNDLFGYPREAWGRIEALGENAADANVGTYKLDCAYGGYRLCQMCAGGGERDVTGRGTAREAYDQIRAFASMFLREAVGKNNEIKAIAVKALADPGRGCKM